MKIRLTQTGFENYNGQMGVVFFEAGLSTNDVRPIDAIRMSAVMQCEWEDGRSANVAQSILDNANTSAPMFSVVPGADNDAEAAAAAELAEVVASIEDPDMPKTAMWTKEQLGAIADRDGIAGLRDIATPLGIKGNSIKEMIAAILAKG
jgi:hypothetical protein